MELSTQESNIDVWATALHNLGGMLAEEAERCEGEASTFLRIQAIAAFVSSLEVCLESAFNLQLAETQLALGRVLLDHSRHANNRFQEVYLFRSIAASESAAHIFTKEAHCEKWAEAQFHIGLALFVHAATADPEIEVSDLENARSHFNSAVIGYQTPERKGDLRKLNEVRRAVTARLKSLKAKG